MKYKLSLMAFSILLSGSLFSNLEANIENDLANIDQGKGRYVLSSDCSKKYEPYPDTPQLIEVTTCSNVTNDLSWTKPTADMAVLCNPNGTEGEMLLSVVAYLNPSKLDNLPTYEEGGKDYPYTVQDEEGNLVNTTYEGYCTTDFGLNAYINTAEEEINKLNGSITVDSETGQITADERTHTYIDTCGSTPSNNWSIKDRKAILCDGNDTEVVEATPYVDGAPNLPEIQAVAEILPQTEIPAQAEVLEGIATEYQEAIPYQPEIQAQPALNAEKSDLPSGRPYYPALEAVSYQPEVFAQVEVNIDDDITADEVQPAVQSQPAFQGRSGRLYFPELKASPSTKCIEDQKVKYEQFLEQAKMAVENAKEATTNTCQLTSKSKIAKNDKYSQNTEKIGKKSKDVFEKIMQEYRKKRVVEYLIALKYREIPKIKQINDRAININSKTPQSMYGMFGDIFYSTSNGVEHYLTISKEEASIEDLQNIALTALGEPTISELSAEFNIEPVKKKGIVFRVIPWWYWWGGSDAGANYPIQWDRDTNWYDMWKHWDHSFLQDLKENHGYKDEQGNFAMDIYFETLRNNYWWWWGNNMFVNINKSWGTKGEFVQNDGLSQRRWYWWWNGGYSIYGKKIHANGVIRYRYNGVPNNVSVFHYGALLIAPYKSVQSVQIPPFETDYSIMKMADEDYDKLMTLVNRVFNYNIADKTWNLGEDYWGNPTVIRTQPGTNKQMTPMDTLAFRMSGEEFQNLVEAARNGSKREVEEFRKITGYDINNLPIFHFKFKARKKKYDIEILNVGVFKCSEGKELKTVVQTSKGKRGICVAIEDIGEQKDYDFIYNPFENEKIISGKGSERGGSPFTFLDFKDSKYYKDHNIEGDIVNTKELTNYSQAVEALLGKVSVNKDLSECINKIGTEGFTFKDVRDIKNMVVDEKNSNFQKSKIRIYSLEDNDVITQALEAKKDSYLIEVDNMLNELSPYIQDSVEDNIFTDIKTQFKNSIEYSDNSTVTIPTKALELNMTAMDYKNFVNIINKDENPITTQNMKPETILKSYNDWKNIANDEYNILNKLYVNEVYVEDFDGNYNIYTISKDELVQNIIETYEDADGIETLRFKNNESAGVSYFENGKYISLTDLNDKIANASLIGFIARDIERSFSAFSLNLYSNYSMEKNVILDNALRNTENICANAIYFDYEADRMIRERLKIWETIIKKTNNYFFGDYQGDNNPSSEYYSLWRAWRDTISGAVTGRTSLVEAEQCEHFEVSLKHIGCEPGRGAMISSLIAGAGPEISGSVIKGFLNRVASIDKYSAINRDDTFNVKGTTIHLGNLNSSFYSPIFSSPAIKGGNIIQYYEKITDRPARGWAMCPDCNQIQYKSRTTVAQELNNALERLQVAFHKNLAGFLNVEAYDKCRNDLHTDGYADIDRVNFNSTFLRTNPKNLLNNKNVSYETRPEVFLTKNGKETKENWVKVVNGSSEDIQNFCSNLISKTKFYQNGNIITNAMESVEGLDKTIGTILAYRMYDKPFKDKWGDKNIFQQEICSSLTMDTSKRELTSGSCDQNSVNIEDSQEGRLVLEKTDILNEKTDILTKLKEELGQVQLDLEKAIEDLNALPSDATQADIDNAQARVDNAQITYDNKQLEVSNAENDVDVANAELDVAQQNYQDYLNNNGLSDKPCETANAEVAYECKNPIIKENEVDKNLIDIGVAIFDEQSPLYNEDTFPFKRAMIEFIDLYEMVQDNETGASKSLTGSLDLMAEIDKMNDYDDKEKILSDYDQCLKFKAETTISEGFDRNDNVVKRKVYKNKDNYFSYKADVCAKTDTLNQPPKYYKGDYCNNGCSCIQDKLIHVKKCEEIINRPEEMIFKENHTCADVDLNKVMKTEAEKERKGTNLKEEENNAFSEMSNESANVRAKMDQGVEKKIDENGGITTVYSNSGAAITANKTNINARQSDYSGAEKGQLRSQEFTNQINTMSSLNSNEIEDQKNNKISTTKTKQELSQTKRIVQSKSGSSGINTSNKNYMESTTRTLTGGVVVNEDLNEGEFKAKKIDNALSGIDNKNELDRELNSGELKEDEYNLDCTNCGSWKQPTEEEVNEKVAKVDKKLGLSEEDKKVELSEDRNDKEVYEEVRSENKYRSATNSQIQEYYRGKEDSSIYEQKGTQLKNSMLDLQAEKVNSGEKTKEQIDKNRQDIIMNQEIKLQKGEI